MDTNTLPTTWPRNDDAPPIRPPEAAAILGLSRERTTAMSRPVDYHGRKVPGYLVPDQEFPSDSGTIRFFRLDYVEAIASLREVFDPEDPARGARAWADWVEGTIGKERTPWFQFYGLTLAR